MSPGATPQPPHVKDSGPLKAQADVTQFRDP